MNGTRPLSAEAGKGRGSRSIPLPENPEMDAYVYKAALYCADCANQIIQGLQPLTWPSVMKADSEYVPQGPYPNGGGEADTPQHCDRCGTFLENPLTPDGDRYVIEQLVEHARTGEGDAEVLKTWGKFYNFQVYEPGEVTIEELRNEYALAFDGPEDCREWWFGAAGELYARGEALPGEWEYRPGLHAVDPDDLHAPLVAAASTEHLRMFARELADQAQKYQGEGAFEEE